MMSPNTMMPIIASIHFTYNKLTFRKFIYDIIYDNIYDILAISYVTVLCLYRHEFLTLYCRHHSTTHFFEHGNFQLFFLKRFTYLLIATSSSL